MSRLGQDRGGPPAAARRGRGRRVSAMRLLAVSMLAALPAGADDRMQPASGWPEIIPVLNVQSAGFIEGHDGWGAPPQQYGPVGNSWLELAVEPGLEGRLRLPHGTTLFGELTGMLTFTGGGLDAAGSNLDPRKPKDFQLEKAYAGWRSGDLLPALGPDAIEISAGSQRYTIGTGMLIRTGATNGGKRGGDWLAARTAFQITGIARLKTGPLLAEAFYLRPNDLPSSNTDIVGANLEYTLPLATLGFSYMRFVSSQIARRNGLDVWDARAGITPLPCMPDFRIDGELAFEDNGGGAGGAYGTRLDDAYGGYVEPGYQFSDHPWKPRLSYRYAFMSGGAPGSNGSRNFDPLFYSSTDWGTWIQGELLGEFQSINSNLLTHQVRLRATPTRNIVLNVIYYHFESATRAASTLTSLPAMVQQSGRMPSRWIGDEVDFMLDLSLTTQLTLSAVYGFNVPGEGARAVTGGSRVWSHAMLYLGWSL